MGAEGISWGALQNLMAAPRDLYPRNANRINAGPIIPDTWQLGPLTHLRKKIARLDVTTIDQYG